MAEQESFQTAMREILEQWKAQIEKQYKAIDEHKAKAEKLEGEAKRQYLEQIKELENKLEGLKAKISDGQES